MVVVRTLATLAVGATAVKDNEPLLKRHRGLNAPEGQEPLNALQLTDRNSGASGDHGAPAAFLSDKELLQSGGVTFVPQGSWRKTATTLMYSNPSWPYALFGKGYYPTVLASGDVEQAGWMGAVGRVVMVKSKLQKVELGDNETIDAWKAKTAERAAGMGGNNRSLVTRDTTGRWEWKQEIVFRLPSAVAEKFGYKGEDWFVLHAWAGNERESTNEVSLSELAKQFASKQPSYQWGTREWMTKQSIEEWQVIKAELETFLIRWGGGDPTDPYWQRVVRGGEVHLKDVRANDNGNGYWNPSVEVKSDAVVGAEKDMFDFLLARSKDPKAAEELQDQFAIKKLLAKVGNEWKSAEDVGSDEDVTAVKPDGGRASTWEVSRGLEGPRVLYKQSASKGPYPVTLPYKMWRDTHEVKAEDQEWPTTLPEGPSMEGRKKKWRKCLCKSLKRRLPCHCPARAASASGSS